MLKPRRRNKVLGLAVGERSALVAEVCASGGGRPQVTWAAEFVYPAGVGLAAAESLGGALSDFLNEHQFAARRVVVGIPAKWVLCRGKEVPPADARAITESLLLQAECEFAGRLDDLAYDFAGETSEAEGRPVMLMAVPSRHVRQVTDLAAAARLRVAAVAPYAATLGAATSRTTEHSQALLLGPGGAEFVAHNRVCPRAIRYLGNPGSAADALAGELLRVAAGMDDGGAGELTVWNDAGADPALCDALGAALGTRCRLGDVRDLGVTTADGVRTDQRLAAPVSLALAGLGPGRVPVDFLHPRLVPPKEHNRRRPLLIGAAAAVVLLAVAAFALADLRHREAALNQMADTLEKRRPAAKSAQAFIDKATFARGWRGGGHPKFLACLRDVTAAAPEDGQTFLTSLNLHEDMKGALSGKSASDAAALALLDRMRAGGRFADAKLSYDSRGVGKGGATREVSFTVTFDYVPKQ